MRLNPHTWPLDVPDNASACVVHEFDSDLCDTSSRAWQESVLAFGKFRRAHCVVDPPVLPSTLVTLTSFTGCLAEASIFATVYVRYRELPFVQKDEQYGQSIRYVASVATSARAQALCGRLQAKIRKSWHHMISGPISSFLTNVIVFATLQVSACWLGLEVLDEDRPVTVVLICKLLHSDLPVALHRTLLLLSNSTRKTSHADPP